MGKSKSGIFKFIQKMCVSKDKNTALKSTTVWASHGAQQHRSQHLMMQTLSLVAEISKTYSLPSESSVCGGERTVYALSV